MKLEQVRARGAGSDGTSLRGLLEGQPALVHRLRAEVVADPVRRRRLDRRCAFMQAATVAGAAGFQRLRLARLDGEPPLIILADDAADTLLSSLPRWRDAPVDALQGLIAVATTLRTAHDEGIVHGALSPTSVAFDAAGVPRLSVLGVQTGDVDVDGTWDALVGNGTSLEDDVRAFGALCAVVACGTTTAALELAVDPNRLATAERGHEALLALARPLLDLEPAWRPAMRDVVAKLTRLLDQQWRATPTTADPPPSSSSSSSSDEAIIKRRHDRLGRFVLERPLGAGAMGEVWRAIDDDTGQAVAVKIIGGDKTPSEKALRRFKKEARLLAELRHPGIARFIDAGEHHGTLYLVTELVEGTALANVIAQRGPLPEREALAIVADLARALVDVHDNGIVHRDIKPDNLLVPNDVAAGGPRVRLIDFGVARHLEEHGSLAMTREGALLGTPLYMSPEQASGRVVDASSDVYAVGTLLYELLIGEAPFAGRGLAQVLAMHIEAPAPRARSLRQDLSQEVDAVIARCLEKDASHRYADAGALLAAVLPLLGEAPSTSVATTLSATPTPPGVMRFELVFDLQSSPQQLWPFVSNTERLNKAIGLGPVEESRGIVDDEVANFGRQQQAGFALAWREHPYEWVFERRLGVARDYSEGPLRGYRSRVELLAVDGGGTRLTQLIEIEPRGFVGRAAAAIEVGVRVRRGLERTYTRIDRLLQGRLDDGGSSAHVVDAFEPATSLPRDVEDRFFALEQLAVSRGADPRAMAAIGEHLRQAPSQELSRIRPVALARRLQLPEAAVVDACYVAGSVGLLKPLWDLLCPSCRVPSSIEETLKALRDHSECDVCRLRYSLDLATSIELVFRVHPSLRHADPATFCISSPAHTPHVVAQVRLAVGERLLLDVDLPEGSYQLGARPLGPGLPFRVRAGAAKTRLEQSLSSWAASSSSSSSAAPHAFPPGRQELTLHNDTDRAQLVRIERTTPRDDVLTAARALSSPLFKRLYPGEVLADDAMVRVAAITLLVLEPVFSSTRPADIEALYGLYRKIDEVVTNQGGAVVRLHGDGVLAVFDDAAAAVRAATSLAAITSQGVVGVRAALHRGPAGAVTMNERLDYFGKSVQEVIALVARARAGELLVSDALADHHGVVFAVSNGAAVAADSTVDDVGYRLRLIA